MSMTTSASGAKAAARPGLSPVCRETRVRALWPVGQEVDPRRCLWIMDLDMPPWGRWRPGQFVMIRPMAWSQERLWARPFSICMIQDNAVRILFQAVGRGTSDLTRLHAGDEVVLWGPLGTGFAQRPDRPTLLLAGGIGLAPFIGYAHVRANTGNMHLILGHRQDARCYPLDLLPDQLSREVLRQQTDADLHVFVDRLEAEIAGYAKHNGLVLACGPTPFLRSVQDLCLRHECEAQLSLENRMACGIGACLGCVAEASQGPPVKVCNQGPVFWAKDVRL